MCESWFDESGTQAFFQEERCAILDGANGHVEGSSFFALFGRVVGDVTTAVIWFARLVGPWTSSTGLFLPKHFLAYSGAHRFWFSGECVKAQEEGSFADSFLNSSTRVARERHMPIAEGFGVLFNGHVSMRILLKDRINQLEIQTP